ncbi:MAG: YggS family pyridoxal phosphate-dependent enzyme [Betaproteobacteria bacterium AqS2]|uniref:Pyridoxal phosphate homeostasis protein n=1 Tax=Candidatus Amphirhobacter heronislandensis TaxID=1732024 RepID=A0A930UGK1_9GAMM|nr:YggS family pyridoxal phosphate-dependent enzyme [Betaproteobacteria bacterium AqS2]
MDADGQRIERRIEQARAKIAAARPDSAPSPLLIAVAKRHGAGAVAAASRCGIKDFGENYLQEAQAKDAALPALDCRWHMLGPLQSNKAAAAARLFSWVHSIDRAKTARRLGQARLDAGLDPMPCCVQVNLGAEATKAGVPPAGLGELLAELAAIDGVEARGLMCLPEAGLDPDGQRRRFGELAALRAEHRIAHPQLEELSMGMSADYEQAVRQGATMVRLGTVLFGPRPA